MKQSYDPERLRLALEEAKRKADDHRRQRDAAIRERDDAREELRRQILRGMARSKRIGDVAFDVMPEPRRPWVVAGCECNGYAYAPGEMDPPDCFGHHPSCERHLRNENARLRRVVDAALVAKRYLDDIGMCPECSGGAESHLDGCQWEAVFAALQDV